MKTTPLNEVLKQITPLPYRVDGTHEVADITTPSPAPHKVLRSDSERWVALAEALDAEGVYTAAYLTHAANVLPGLVELLELAANQAVTLANLVEDERSLYKADEAAFRQALATATNVPTP